LVNKNDIFHKALGEELKDVLFMVKTNASKRL